MRTYRFSLQCVMHLCRVKSQPVSPLQPSCPAATPTSTPSSNTLRSHGQSPAYSRQDTVAHALTLPLGCDLVSCA